MRRDQLVFLLLGIVLGVVLGGVIGVVSVRPELIGAAPAAPSERASSENRQAGTASNEDLSARLDALRDRLARDPQDAHTLLELAQTHWRLQRRSDAIAHAQRAVEFAGSDAHVYFSAAEVLAQARSYSEALDALRAGLRHDKRTYEPAEAAFGIALLKVGDLELAQELLAEMGARAPGPERVVPAKQRLDQIRDVLGEAEAKPDSYEAQVAAGNYFYDTHQWERAAASYGRAREIRDDDPNMLTDFGTVLAELGRFDEAHELFERSLLLDQNHWKAAYNGTIIAIRTGDASRALEWVSRLRLANPAHPQLASLESQARSLAAN